jgi:uncharacterized surface protein with fasciclin (FAS1) repeats
MKDKEKTEMSEDKMSDEKNIVETAAANEDFSTFVAAVKAAELEETLSGDGPFTVFAPNEAAFAKLPEGTLGKLLHRENKEMLAKILKYHVLPKKVMAADAKTMKAKTVEGTKISVEVKDDGVMIDGAECVKTDIEASNGVIHVIDTVLMPEMSEGGDDEETEEDSEY